MAAVGVKGSVHVNHDYQYFRSRPWLHFVQSVYNRVLTRHCKTFNGNHIGEFKMAVVLGLSLKSLFKKILPNSRVQSSGVLQRIPVYSVYPLGIWILPGEPKGEKVNKNQNKIPNHEH